MFERCVLSLALLIGLSLSTRAQQPQPAPGSEVKSVTLYGPLARAHDDSRAFVSFKTGAYGPSWDLGYGSLYVSEARDWLQVSTAKGARTAFRDLGAFGWTDKFKVPVVEPFPKLKEGEPRQIVMSADGANGRPARTTGPKALAGPPGDYDVSRRESPIEFGYFPPNPLNERAEPATQTYVQPPLLTSRRPAPTSPAAPRAKQNGVAKVDPVFARAIPGHMYVMRVVDDAEDFYVLFRVESVVRGDNCTITWKRVPAPDAQARPEVRK